MLKTSPEGRDCYTAATSTGTRGGPKRIRQICSLVLRSRSTYPFIDRRSSRAMAVQAVFRDTPATAVNLV